MIFIIIKFGEKLRDIYNRTALDFPNPRLASWTDFNAHRPRTGLMAYKYRLPTTVEQ